MRFTRSDFLVFTCLLFGLAAGACTPVQSAPTQPGDLQQATATSVAPSATPAPTNTSPPTTAPTETPTRTPRPTAVPFLVPVSADPIIPVVPGTWNSRYIEPGAATYHDGALHVFFNAFNRWPGKVDIGYATSVDGIDWEVHPDPVLSKEQAAEIPYAPHNIYVSDVLVDTSGTWVLYFYTWDEGLASAPGVIGRATAPGPLGPWTADAQPLLVPAPAAGHWDSFAVRSPSVVKTEAGYVMYFSGTDLPGVPVPQKDVDRIGMATSPDGLIWTKYDDPASTQKPYSLSDPVLEPDQDLARWDGRTVQRPSVELTETGWILFYRANKGDIASGNQTGCGFATSPDGIHWTRNANNPVMRASLFKSTDMYATNMIYVDGVFYVFAEVSRGQNTEVFLATGVLP